jgi:glutathione S-transferase
MIELWHCADARSFRVLWTLEELGIPYELHVLPFPPRERAPQYLKVNPLGTIPAMRDGDTFMTESAGIVQYLATRHAPNELLVAVEDSAYGAWLNWLYFGEATLTFPQTIVLRYRQLEPGHAEHIADDYARWFMSRLRQVDRGLQDGAWLCANRFTAADISVGYALLLADYLKLSARFTTTIAEYWTNLSTRPAFLAAKRAQGGSMASELASRERELRK